LFSRAIFLFGALNSRIVTPTTSYPCRASSAAATEESTPPLIATTARLFLVADFITSE
jgi:hypothetical protein